MNTSRTLVLIISTALAASSARAGVLVEEIQLPATREARPFTHPRHLEESLMGVATCAQDDELYKKNKDHGPVIWYDVSFTDATVRFASRPDKTKRDMMGCIEEGESILTLHVSARLAYRVDLALAARPALCANRFKRRDGSAWAKRRIMCRWSGRVVIHPCSVYPSTPHHSSFRRAEREGSCSLYRHREILGRPEQENRFGFDLMASIPAFA